MWEPFSFWMNGKSRPNFETKLKTVYSIWSWVYSHLDVPNFVLADMVPWQYWLFVLIPTSRTCFVCSSLGLTLQTCQVNCIDPPEPGCKNMRWWRKMTSVHPCGLSAGWDVQTVKGYLWDWEVPLIGRGCKAIIFLISEHSSTEFRLT